MNETNFLKYQEFLTHKRKYRISLILKILRLTVFEVAIVALLLGLEAWARVNGEISPNTKPLALAVPFLVLFYYIAKSVSGSFNLSTLSLRHGMILFSDSNQKKFKAVVILQIENIPKNITVKENRIRKKNIEKLIIPGNLQYLHYHLTFLAQYVPNLSFDISVVKNEIRLRLIFSYVSNSYDETVENIEILKNLIKTVFQTIYPGIKFKTLEGNQLKSAWGDFLGGYDDCRIRYQSDKLLIERGRIDNSYLSILKVLKPPNFYYNKQTQIDKFIQDIMGSQFELNYVIAAEPSEIYKFVPHSLTDGGNTHIQETTILEALEKLRHSEITAIWNVSAYLIVRSNSEKDLESDIQRIKTIISSVFGTELSIVNSRKLKKNLLRIPNRCPLTDHFPLTSEQLAILLHLPENPVPTISRIDIPEFSVPPERKIADGVAVGKVLYNDQEIYPLKLSTEMLRLSMFVSGESGVGKTHFVINLLRQLYREYPEINWICIDWSGEYTHLNTVSQNEFIEEYAPNTALTPLTLNMFDPQGTSAEEHARKLLMIIQEIFHELFIVPEMEEICLRILKQIIRNPNMRDIDSFIRELKDYIREGGLLDKKIVKNIKSIMDVFSRLKRLDTVFNKEVSINFRDLLEKKVILNLSYLSKEVSEKEKQLVANLFLKYIVDASLRNKPTDNLRYLIVIENCHTIVPSVLREVPETDMMEDIPFMLKGVGTSFIAITPYPNAYLNSSAKIKVIFRCPYAFKVATYLPLNEAQEKYLQNLPRRESLVQLPSFDFCFRFYSDYIDISKLPYVSIEDINNHSIETQDPEKDQDRSTTMEVVASKPPPNSEFIADSEVSRQIGQDRARTIPFSLSRVIGLLKAGPQTAKKMANQLAMDEVELHNALHLYESQRKIMTCDKSFFHSKKVEQVYFLPKDAGWVEHEIKMKLESDFVTSGILDKLPTDDPFDYLVIRTNSLLKVISPLNMDPETFDKSLLDLYEQAIDRNVYEIAIVTPHFEWVESICSWLATNPSNQIFIFTYDVDDWERLSLYLKRGIHSK